MRFGKTSLTLGWILALACNEAAYGDGGTVRLSRREGGYRISVFTSPTPFRAGPVDISVFVQDGITAEPVNEVRVTVTLTLHDRPGKTIHQVATMEAATNKLFRAATFELVEPGWWDVEVAVEGSSGLAQIHFELLAGTRAPRWLKIWPWICWPIPVILLFSIHQWLAWRKLRQRS
jgi:hypothetical protein